MQNQLLVCCLFLLLLACEPKPQEPIPEAPSTPSPDAISLLGKALYMGEPSANLLARYEEKKAAFIADSTNVENIIWHGRFTAYIGAYADALEIYSRGIKLFPEDARLYRHRGHRYLTIRKLDEAVIDFQKAAELIAGTPNQVEPDGMPNAQNIPVSTLHGNIYYHLGLTHYLRQEMPQALEAYQKCLASSGNNDNLVSSTHWLYMIARRMGNESLANSFLEPIQADLEIIENMAYHQACLFYKGALSLEDLNGDEKDAPANDALAYGVANWHYYNGDISKAKAAYEAILAKDSWNSFGYLAAESDYANLDLGQ